METRILKYFLTVAHTKNITQAANLLHITQPTLSRQLKQLETELNAKLLIRGKREITLTAQGKILERQAKTLLQVINQTKEEIQNFDLNSLNGTIRIGYVESNASFFINDTIAQFQKKHPLVKFQTYSAIGDDIKNQIDNGILDIGIVITPIETAKYHYFQLPITDQWGIFVNQQHPLAHYQNIMVTDLKNYPIIYPWRNILQDELQSVIGLNPQTLNVKIIANLPSNSLQFVHQFNYCMLGIQSINRFNPYQDVKFIPFKNSFQTCHGLIWQKNHHYSNLINSFIEFVKYHVSHETLR